MPKRKVPEQESVAKASKVELDATTLPRVNEKLGMQALKEEMKARGGELKGMSSLTKGQALEILRIGSIHLCGTSEYKAYQALRSLMNREDAAARAGKTLEQYDFEIAESESRWKQREEEIQMRKKQEKEEHQKRVRAYEREQEASREARKREVEEQKHLHSIHNQQIHPCPLAPTQDLKLYGAARIGKATCEWSNCVLHGRARCSGQIAFSCEACDFDACAGCVSFQTMTETDKEQMLARERVKDQKKQEEEMRLRKQAEEERKKQWAEYERQEAERRAARQAREAEEKRARDAEKAKALEAIFKQHTGVRLSDQAINPPPANKYARKHKAFVVWSSDGYRPDGWHGYHAPPEKTFNFSFDTLKDANSRALALFYAQNPWGLSVGEMEEQFVEERVIEKGLWLQTCPEDSTEWTVGVVPRAAFVHLSHHSGR